MSAPSPADVARLHPQILAAIGTDFGAFCGSADKPFRRRSAKASEARNGLYAVGTVAIAASLVIELLTIDRVLDWFPDWFPHVLLVISGLFVLGVGIVGTMFERTERIFHVEAAEMTLKLVAKVSTLTIDKEGYGFELEDFEGFASVLGGHIPAESLMAHARWRREAIDFEAVYSREEGANNDPSTRRYLFRIDHKGDEVAPIFVVPASAYVPGLMAPPPGTDVPPLAVTSSIDLGDADFARHFRCYSADFEGAQAAMHGVMRATLVAITRWMDTTRLRLVILDSAILGVIGPVADSDYARRSEDGPVLDSLAAWTTLCDLSVPLHIADGLLAAETHSAAIAAAP